jgi:hypothetical protein
VPSSGCTISVAETAQLGPAEPPYPVIGCHHLSFPSAGDVSAPGWQNPEFSYRFSCKAPKWLCSLSRSHRRSGSSLRHMRSPGTNGPPAWLWEADGCFRCSGRVGLGRTLEMNETADMREGAHVWSDQ